MALLGVLSAIGSNRVVVAQNLVGNSEARAESARRDLLERAKFGASPAICRTFVASQFSPPPAELARMQREFDEQCKWFKGLVKALEALPSEKLRLEGILELSGARPRGGEPWAYESLDAGVEGLKSSLEELNQLRSEAQVGGLELALRFLGPYLLVLALALRMTKVTAEVRGERRRLG